MTKHAQRMHSIDLAIVGMDRVLRVLVAPARPARRNPADECAAVHADAHGALSEAARQHAAGLMRVNHVGEICAQALYQAQALTSREPALRTALEHAAAEEIDHLAWTEQRLAELGSRTSMLNPLWFAGAFVMGAAAGLAGDKWSLGFLAETERQVEQHLAGHLGALPEQDVRSRAIVSQMKTDEAGHAQMAQKLGATELPSPIKLAMRLASRVMTTLAYRI